MNIAGFTIPEQGVWTFPARLTHGEVAKIPAALWQKVPSTGSWQLDLSPVHEIDSAFLALLLKILRLSQTKGLQVKLAGLNKNAEALLEVYGIIKLFEKYLK